MQSPWTVETQDAGSPDFGSPTPRSLTEILSPWTILVLAFGCLILDQVLTMALWSSGHHSIAIIVGGLGGVLLPMVLILRALGLSWRRELNLHPLRWWEFCLVTTITLSFLPPIYALDVLSERLFPPGPDALEFYSGLVPHDLSSWIGGFLAVVIVGPLAEEVLFRGILFQLGIRYVTVPIAVVATALVFGISHQALWLLLPLTALGVLLGMLAWMTRNVTCAWLAHAIFNLGAFVEMGWFRDPSSSRLQAWSQQAGLWIPSLGLAIASMIVLARCLRAQRGKSLTMHGR
jgi:membrane protease YdiL (CAAX protease family)